MTSQPLVQIRNVSKSFGGVRALQDVTFEIAPGEIHALCGENGAGKSTLNKVLSGSLIPDSGEVWFNGARLRHGSVVAAETAGVAIIHQESTAFLHLNAEDNIFVGREPRVGILAGLGLRKPSNSVPRTSHGHEFFLDRASMREQTRQLLDRLGEKFDPRKPLGELTFAQRQMVGIARALSHSCRLLIMDEPTASLSGRETEVLFHIIRQLRSQGVSILYVSHRLQEVFELAGRVTVLRDGRLIGTRLISEVDRDELIRMMVGRETPQPESEPASASPKTGEPLLEVKGLTCDGVFRDVSFSIRAGEIVGLSGLVGAGRSEVARTIFGIERADRGAVTVAGEPLFPGSPHEAMRRGLALVPEDRQRQGLALPMPVGQNLTLAILERLTRGGLMAGKLEDRLVERLMRDLSIRAASPRLPAESLSGGNQQKVLLGKWLAREPSALILDEPTRGIDVGAKAEVHRLIRDLAARGVAILLISSELPEILAMSDRIIVMREGTVSGELPREEATQEKILNLALPTGSQNGAAAARPGIEDGRKRGEGTEESSFGRALRALAQRREYGVLAVLVVTLAAVASVNPAFATALNIMDMLVKAAPVAIVGCGLTLVIVTREIDISVGSLRGLLFAVVGVLVVAEKLALPAPAGVGLTLLLGAGVGLLNGFLVTVGRVPSIIVTLGMLFILRGATEVVMGGEWITGLPSSLRYLGTGAWMGVPVSVWTAAAVIAVTILIAQKTPLGRWIYAVGSSPRSAVLAGVSPRRIRLFAFTYTGFLTGVAMLVSDTQLSTVESGIGVGFELLAVTCVVVGGTSISGGKGTIVGTVLGVLLLTNVGSFLIFLKLPETAYWERAIQGVFILAAVLVDHLARRRSGALSQSG